MTTRHRHRFQRLSDSALFCECGEVKQITVPPQPVEPSITVYPVPYPVPYTPPPWPVTTTPLPWVQSPNTTITYDGVTAPRLDTFSTRRPDVFIPRTTS